MGVPIAPMAGPAPSRYAESLGLADASLTMSPAHSRLCELTHRMTAVHDDFEAEKKARSSVMELKCRAIDEKTMRNKRSEDERLKPIYILIERLGLDIGSERDHLSYLDVKLNEEVKELEKAMQDEIEDQRKQRSDLEAKITKQIDQACINLREDFAREKERRDESQKRREKKVADEILRITESLDIERKGRVELETVFSEALEEKALIVQLEMAQEKKIRQENAKNTYAGFKDAMDRLNGKLQTEQEQREADEEALIKKLLADINEVHNGIKCEGTIRMDSENHIVRVLEDMCGKLHNEIGAERKDRQQTEQVFMKLLDETCESIALRASSKTLAELSRKSGA